MYNDLGIYYTKFDIIVNITLTILFLALYIYLKASNKKFSDINWQRVFYEVRRYACILLCKLFNK